MLKSARAQALMSAFQNRVLVIDGAMGTALQGRNLTTEDFGGIDFDGFNENLVFTRPQLIQDIHEGYLKTGCDIIETNTFSSAPITVKKYGLGRTSPQLWAEEQNRLAAQIARKAAEKYSSPDRLRFVAGSIGPTTQAISITGDVSFEVLQENFYIQAKGLFEGGADYLLFETCQDTRNIKAGIFATEQLFREKGEKIPVAVSVTIEPMGTMLAGQSIEALLASLSHLDLLYLGLNCATGPEFMTDAIRTLARLSPFRVACVPNAGLPDENGCYLETPGMLSHVLSRFLKNGWVNLIGGCCGTHAGHIRALVDLVAGSQLDKTLHIPSPPSRPFLSGIECLDINEEVKPIIVGEKAHTLRSKNFKTLLCEGLFEEASEVARAQLKAGVQIINVCVANPDRDELKDMRSFLEFAIKKIRAPLMIESTNAQVIELALTYCQGKAIIKSINLEDGRDHFEKVITLARQYGAALVIQLTHGRPEKEITVSPLKTVKIAERQYLLLTNKYGIHPEDIYWDLSVISNDTVAPESSKSGIETIEKIRLLKKRFPLTQTVLRISNGSIGLPEVGRDVLNSAFLHLCVLRVLIWPF